MPNLWARTRTTLEMIKWEHSIFALPFALTATILAAHGLPALRTLFWILVAMVSARSAAMAFNRWADADIDAANPRTRTRAIPAGLLTRQFVFGFTVLMAGIFMLSAAALNHLALLLSPAVLIVLFSFWPSQMATDAKTVILQSYVVAFTAVWGYFLGSSSGSKAKDAVIAGTAKTPPTA